MKYQESAYPRLQAEGCIEALAPLAPSLRSMLINFNCEFPPGLTAALGAAGGCCLHMLAWNAYDKVTFSDFYGFNGLGVVGF